jgi:hypothetical protein
MSLNLENVNTGTAANSRDGDPLRNGFTKINHNFSAIMAWAASLPSFFFSINNKFAELDTEDKKSTARSNLGVQNIDAGTF